MAHPGFFPVWGPFLAEFDRSGKVVGVSPRPLPQRANRPSSRTAELSCLPGKIHPLATRIQEGKALGKLLAW